MRVIVNVPATAKRGEVIEIRTLAGHDMETGFRRTQDGQLIPRNIITSFVATYNKEEIFRAVMGRNRLARFARVGFYDQRLLHRRCGYHHLFEHGWLGSLCQRRYK